MSAGAKLALGGARRAFAAQPVRCSCDCCHTARRREHMQAACISTAATLAAFVAAGVVYALGRTFL
jgi:hypothetical protein